MASMLSVGESATALSDIKDPSQLTWGLLDVSDPEAGRTQQTAKMQKGRIAQKRKLQLGQSGTTPEETAAIMQAFNAEYVFVRYPDALTGTDETREFYVGDRTGSMNIWTIDNKRYTSISFDIIER